MDGGWGHEVDRVRQWWSDRSERPIIAGKSSPNLQETKRMGTSRRGSAQRIGGVPMTGTESLSHDQEDARRRWTELT